MGWQQHVCTLTAALGMWPAPNQGRWQHSYLKGTRHHLCSSWPHNRGCRFANSGCYQVSFDKLVHSISVGSAHLLARHSYTCSYGKKQCAVTISMRSRSSLHAINTRLVPLAVASVESSCFGGRSGNSSVFTQQQQQQYIHTQQQKQVHIAAAHHVGMVHAVVGSASGGAGLVAHAYELHTCT